VVGLERLGRLETRTKKINGLIKKDGKGDFAIAIDYGCEDGRFLVPAS
jgi:hypothetical protein